MAAGIFGCYSFTRPHLQKSSKTDSQNGIETPFELPARAKLAGPAFLLRDPEQHLVRHIKLTSSDHEMAVNHAPPLPFRWLHRLWVPSSVLNHPHRLLGSLAGFRLHSSMPFLFSCFGGFPVPPERSLAFCQRCPLRQGASLSPRRIQTSPAGGGSLVRTLGAAGLLPGRLAAVDLAFPPSGRWRSTFRGKPKGKL